MTASRFRVILYTIAAIVSLVTILWTDGASEVCWANAAGNDAGKRGRAAKISGSYHGCDVLVKVAEF